MAVVSIPQATKLASSAALLSSLASLAALLSTSSPDTQPNIPVLIILALLTGASAGHLLSTTGSAGAASGSDDGGKEGSKDGEGEEKDEKEKEKKEKEKTDEEKKKAREEAREKRKKEQREVEKKQKWRKQEQIWSDQTYQWEDRVEKDEDEDGESADAGLFFVARHRVDPKVDTDGQGLTDVLFRADPLIVVLRRRMKSVEDLYETEASCDAKDLFLYRSRLEDELSKMQARIAELKEREAKAGPKPESTSEDKKDAEDKKPETSDSTPTADKVADSKSPETAPEAKVEEVTVKTEEEKPSVEEKKEVGDEKKAAESDEDEEDGEYAHISREQLELQAEQTIILLSFIKTEFANTQAKLDRLYADEQISFKLLWCLFVPGEVIETTEPGTDERMGFKLRRATYGSDQLGAHFMMSGHIIEWTGARYTKVPFSKKLQGFKGLRKIKTLPAFPLDDKGKTELTERGRKYVKFSGVHYVTYSGPLIKYISGQIVKSRADGRVIVDISGYRKMEPGSDMWGGADYDDDDDDELNNDGEGDGAKAMETLEEHHLCLTPPNVYGFSLSLKEWGEMSFSKMKDIVFEDAAYDHLVLDDDYKHMIQSLVKAACTPDLSEHLLSDVIQNKAGGLIILLHGTPGTGKTLTAEAVAEQLKRPLYSIGAGELGLEARNLERNLRDTLEVTNQWKAVVLIDEADVFLEQRSDHEIQRNALVSVFLRLLEYHSGVLFLTTNRIKSFDAAFLSRFSIALKYPDLDTEQRIMIWIKFIKLVGGDVEKGGKRKLTNGVLTAGQSPAVEAVVAGGGVGTDAAVAPTPPPTPPPKASVFSMAQVRKWAAKPINGRIIKQTIRTAQALALASDEPLKEEHIETVLKIQERFTKDFETYSAEDLYKAKDAPWRSADHVYQ